MSNDLKSWYLEDPDSKIDSKIILSSNEVKTFKELFDKNQKFKLLYRGSKDGFLYNNFQGKCYN